MHPKCDGSWSRSTAMSSCRVASRHRDAGRRFPRWHVSWTRTVLVPAVAPGSAGANRALAMPRRRGSSV